MKTLSLLITLLYCSTSFSGGGWISSGGELFKDAYNPWFVRNVTSVKYCIDIDESTISASKADIESTVDESIKYWKSEFEKSAHVPSKAIKLGTQKFSMTDCQDPEVKIQFLFGHGSLNQEQIDYLKNPTKYIGVTVRTHYDPKTLSGKGFVYISSDKGPFSYENAQSALIDHAWEHKKLLKYAILHELGHIFGTPHTGTGLMSEVFLDQLLSKNLSPIYLAEQIQPFLHPDNKLEDCYNEGGFGVSFFEGSVAEDCISSEYSKINGTWTFYSRREDKTKRTKIGELRNIQLGVHTGEALPSSILKITTEQQVFTHDEIKGRAYMVGPLYSHYTAKAVYIGELTKKPKSVYIQITPTSVVIVGVINKKPRVVFDYTSPINGLLSKITVFE